MLSLNRAKQKNAINTKEKHLKVPGFEAFSLQCSNKYLLSMLTWFQLYLTVPSSSELTSHCIV